VIDYDTSDNCKCLDIYFSRYFTNYSAVHVYNFVNQMMVMLYSGCRPTIAIGL